MYRRTIQRLLCAYLIALLGLVTVGCAPHSTSSNLLPPQADNPRDYEEIEVFTAAVDDPADEHTLYSRPLNWRSTGDKGTKWCTVDPSIGILRVGWAHNAEYHAGWAYFMPGVPNSKILSPYVSAPLYACDATGNVVKIIDPATLPGITMYDFSVSPDGRFVMLYDEDKDGGGILALHIWSVEQEKIIALFYADDSEAPASGKKQKELTETHLTWDTPAGYGYWHEVAASGQPSSYTYTAVAIGDEPMAGVESYAVIQFMGDAAKNATIKRYPVSTGVYILDLSLQMLDPATNMVAYDDYPHFIEYGKELFDFDRAQTPTHLFLYNVTTGTNTCIDELPACYFLPQWTGADTLEYNVRSDPVVRTDPPSPEPPNIYVSRRYVSLLTRSDCLPIVYSVTSSGGEEEYHYAIIDLTTMKLFKDTGTLATSKTAGTLKGWLFFPKIAPWHLYSESTEGTTTRLKPAAGTTVTSTTFKVGNKLYSGNQKFTPSQSLLDAVTDISGEITDPGIVRVIECTPSSSSKPGIQCAVDKIEGGSKENPWFYTRYTFLYKGTTDCQIEFRQNQKSITTLCRNPKAGGAPSIIADTLTGVNNLFVPVTPKFNPAFIGWSPDSKTTTLTTAFLSPG
ncbi:hypothetical protein SMC3_05845 [Candidatus Cryosericum hinesii]|jgi:hypothetical protein|uniref:Bacterial repeat domain-containing protein n=1 Tax=Candidatus Cryosericum hinesii TaxID=2290915 RepID=A0A398DE69_9BACT|nr:hypothetical protein [Candidatus Cryosericum hinesii]RIE09016.1 hypothetical protein SMC4_06480 [Candidatus Cryosericum hinesii]RIE12783.1 hypothetical protein SMC3_05845 [Candidatus Cryosericum hinesii]RIE12836.1 hypothetical protein SMC2_06220 [Candidatus Cryosericum hinesii]